MKVVVPQGGYFIVADWGDLGKLFRSLQWMQTQVWLWISLNCPMVSYRIKSRAILRDRRMERLSFHQMVGQKCWCAGHTANGLLQRRKQSSNGDVYSLMLLQAGWNIGEGHRPTAEMDFEIKVSVCRSAVSDELLKLKKINEIKKATFYFIVITTEDMVKWFNKKNWMYLQNFIVEQYEAAISFTEWISLIGCISDRMLL